MTASCLPEGVFWSDGALRLRCTHAVPDGAYDLLESVTWGTTGARFRMPHLREGLTPLTDLAWIAMEDDGELVGVYALQERARTWNGERVPMLYRTALAIAPAHLGRHLGRPLVEQTRRFAWEHLARGVVFGFIEDDNSRSLVLSERVGYQRVATFENVMLSRLRPRPVPGVRRLDPSERAWMVEALDGLYARHALCDFDASVRADRVWVLEDAGRRVAAIEACTHRWVLQSLGFGGWLRALIGWVPVYRHLVVPDDHRFVWVQNHWFAEGHASGLYPLIEGVLHAEGQRVASMLGDPISPVWQAFRGAGRLGAMAPFKYAMHVMAGRIGLDPHDGPFGYTLNGV